MLGERLREIRELRKLTQDDVANFLKIKRQTYSAYERNKSVPDANTLSLLATFFSVTTDYLLNREETPKKELKENQEYEVALTEKDKKQIKQQAESIKTTLMGSVGLAFDGRINDEETLAKVMQALEEGLALAKKEAKEKYTPKKHRNKKE